MSKGVELVNSPEEEHKRKAHLTSCPQKQYYAGLSETVIMAEKTNSTEQRARHRCMHT